MNVEPSDETSGFQDKSRSPELAGFFPDAIRCSKRTLTESPLTKALLIDFMFQRRETLTNSRGAEHLPCV